RDLWFARTADHVPIGDPRQIHSNVGPNLVLIPMPGIYFDEKPLSIAGIPFKLNLRDSAVATGLEQALREWHDLRNVYRLDCAAGAKKRRVLSKFSCREVSRHFLLCIHEAATHGDVGIGAINVLLKHNLGADGGYPQILRPQFFGAFD